MLFSFRNKIFVRDDVKATQYRQVSTISLLKKTAKVELERKGLGPSSVQCRLTQECKKERKNRQNDDIVVADFDSFFWFYLQRQSS